MEWIWPLLMVPIGILIFARGFDALKTGQMRSRTGYIITGQPAKLLGWMLVILGPLVACSPVFRLILN